jgi:hypothetical protein
VQIHHAKTMIELIQDASAVMGKVEVLVDDLPPPPTLSTSHNSASPLSKHLERTASELSRLHFFMTKGGSVPLINDLKPRVATATERLAAVLRATLAVVLPLTSPDADAAAKRCIHSCSLIGNIATAHDAVRTVLLRPALEEAAAAADGGANHAGTVCAPLATFFAEARTCLKPLLHRIGSTIAERPEMAQSFDILGACTLAEVHAVIKRHLPGAFSPAVPAAFHANFTASTAFLQWLEGLAPAGATVQLFRGGAERASFTKEWNLAIYFSVRFQEIAWEFEQTLHSGPQPAAASKFQRFGCEQSERLWVALAKCRDPATTFPAVFERFFKLQLQLVLRFTSWLQEVEGVRATVQAAGDGATVNVAEFAGFEAGGMKDWARTANPQKLVQMLGEVTVVVRVLREEVAPAIVSHLSVAASEAAMQKVPEVQLA